jgi:hypothetical protein
MPENQLPLAEECFLWLLAFNMKKRIIAPESKRITVKLEGSMEFSPRANRHSTEFAANAISARIVNTIVLTAE